MPGNIDKIWIDAAVDFTSKDVRNAPQAKIEIASQIAGERIPNWVDAEKTIAEFVGEGSPLPSNQAIVTNGAALTVPVDGEYTDTATITVADGVITGITLS